MRHQTALCIRSPLAELLCTATNKWLVKHQGNEFSLAGKHYSSQVAAAIEGSTREDARCECFG